MLLHEALVHTECPICLQPLDCRLRPPPSRPACTPSRGTSATATTGIGSTSSSGAPGGSPHSPLQPSRPNATGGAGEFRITFGPGVYGSDAADPWHPSLTVPTPAPPHEAPDSSVQNRSAYNESRLPFSGDGSDLPGHGHSACSSSGSSSEEGAAGVVVLPCGHLLHHLCVMQLCEYATHLSCPVCRLKLASDADVILFRPQLRVSSIAAAQALVSVPSSCYEAEGKCMTATATRKRSRAEEAGREEGEAPYAGSLRADGDATGSLQSASCESASQRVGVPYRAVACTPTVQPSRERRTATPIFGHDVGPTDTGAAPETPALPGVWRQNSSADASTSQGEDDITIVGARQLPPSQAYAELLLRTTASWAARTETLKARVEHLERSRQLLQSDCSELERTLTVARRRREVLLNLPSSKEQEDALRSAHRLRELRRLCLETRAAITTATAQLAEAVRDHAEVRRQTEKYTRKLARLEGGEGGGSTTVDPVPTPATVARADLPPPSSP
ncbi:hypothetical protein JIQ42_05034 [Leishmania sp. Namibia]|uniref:hypothetical protein n=1 Tax=Leishmania sp. Namibia TaxID=2802991 RepID=UPI001B3F7C09|nr:hypothetical protein JIQ42_05034 [Leishmania sp. Namibia]